MKTGFFVVLLSLVCFLLRGQTVVVAPDGSITTVSSIGNSSVAVGAGGMQSAVVTTGNIVTVINADGSHSVGLMLGDLSGAEKPVNSRLSIDTLTVAWVSDSVFQKPESALYDSRHNNLYVSNINGKYLAKDGNGFISQLKPDGSIVQLKWVDGLNNPQGLGLHKNKLYVADINRIVRIDIVTARVDKVWEIPDAEFLNDLTTDTNGDVYVSDCRKNRLYRLHNDKVSLWLENSLLSAPNGLLCMWNALMLVNTKDGKVYRINKKSGRMQEFCSGIKNADGIVSDGQDGFFVTGAWQGEVFHIDASGQKRLVLYPGKDKIITADLCCIPSQHLLIIPTLQKTVIGATWEEVKKNSINEKNQQTVSR